MNRSTTEFHGGASAQEERVAIAIVRQGDVFLVGTRAPGQALEGYAEFPGGKCLPEESFEACVVRECWEETGLAVAVRGFRQEITHAYPHGLVRLRYFDCEPEDAALPRPPFRWVSRHALAELRFPEANEAVIAALLREV